MDTQLVQVANFNFPSDPEFILFIHELEHAGIEYVCPEKIQLENQPLLTIGLGGLRVLVNIEDATEAKAILEGLNSDEPMEPDEADMELARRRAEEEKSMQKSYFVIKAFGVFLVVLILVGVAQCVAR
jgi:hypothetical protein